MNEVKNKCQNLLDNLVASKNTAGSLEQIKRPRQSKKKLVINLGDLHKQIFSILNEITSETIELVDYLFNKRLEEELQKIRTGFE